jgi:WD40 repeat protein/tRNA A-37 threonylcarbamoyl transferase component Bud32
MPNSEPVSNCLKCGSPTATNASGGYCAQCLFAGLFATSQIEPPGSSASGIADIPALKPSRSQRPELGSFGNYELLAEIARGGMGVVYKARQKSVQRVVALKMVLAGRFASDSEIKRFRIETEAATHLDHPNIVPIYEVGDVEGQPYFTMKLIEGGSLAGCILRYHENQRLGAKLMATVARAVHHAHQRGVLHRDLKPANILLDAAGEPFITDFGLARSVESGGDLTITGTILGTPNFMAPEQAAGSPRSISTAADIYSLGAILYFILTNRPPFVAATPLETLRLVQDSPVQRPSSVHLKTNRELETICLKCLEKEPGKRYGSALALAEDLERWLRHESILARRSTPAERAIKWVKRKPVVAASAASVALAVTVGLAGFFWQWRQTESALANTAALLTKIEIEKADGLLSRGETSGGLAYLARVLRRDPNNTVAARRLSSVLQERTFGLPTLVRPAATGVITHAVFSPDRRRVLVTLRQGFARIWDVHTGEPASAVMVHQDAILRGEFSQDGTKVVTASSDHTAGVWDAKTGFPLAPALTHAKGVDRAHFSPDGRRVITAAFELAAHIWNAESGELELTVSHPTNITILGRFTPDGLRVVTLAQNWQTRAWDSHSGEPLNAWRTRGSAARPILAMAELGGAVASISGSTVWIWTAGASSNSVPDRNLVHPKPVWNVAFSPEGKLLVTCGDDGLARLWNVATGQAAAAPMPHLGPVRSAVFSRDGTRLITVSADHTVRLWESRSGRPLTEQLKQEGRVLDAQFSDNEDSIMSIGTDGTIYHWRLLRPSSQVPEFAAGPELTIARFSPSGRSILTGASDGAIGMWDLSGKAILPGMNHGAPIAAAQLSPDETKIATAGGDSQVKVWDAKSGALLLENLSCPKKPRDVLFHTNGTSLVALVGEGLRHAWNLTTGDRELSPPLKNGRWDGPVIMRSGALSPNGKLVAVAGWLEVRLFDYDTGQEVGSHLGHTDWMDECHFSPDSRRVATASGDSTARIWEAPSGKPITPPLRHAGRVFMAQFSPDGQRVVTASEDGTARVWDAATGQPLTEPLRHDGPVRRAEFSPDGLHLLTLEREVSVHLWNSWTGQRIAEPISTESHFVAATFSPDSQTVLAASAGGKVRLCPLPLAPLPVPAWLPDLAEALTGQKIDDAGRSQAIAPADAKLILRKLRKNASPEPVAVFMRDLLKDLSETD